METISAGIWLTRPSPTVSRVKVCDGVGEAHALLRHADDDAADDVDGDDHQAGDGVAAHEFAGAVHGAEEIGFRFEVLAAALGFLLVDQAGGQIGVDRHLLAGHGVQGEARRDFGDAARTLGDDDEVHDAPGWRRRSGR